MGLRASLTRPGYFWISGAAVAGTAITVTLDGKRPLIGEVQALLATPSNSSPRRAVSGIDHALAAMIAAVWKTRPPQDRGQRRLPVHCGRYAADRSVVGPGCRDRARFGLREPAVAGYRVMIGEVGSAGDLRRVSGMERRWPKPRGKGFTTALIPPRCDAAPTGCGAGGGHHRGSAGTHARHRRAPARSHRHHHVGWM